MSAPSHTWTNPVKGKRRAAIAVAIATVGLTGWALLKPKPQEAPKRAIVRDVTAQGRLIPEGGLVELSIPAGTAGGNEVVERWFVQEGAPLRKGQLLARLSSYGQLKAALQQAEATLKSTKSLLPYLIISQDKGKELFGLGAVSQEELGKAQASLISREAEIQGGNAAVKEARLKLEAAEIRSPLDGSLIRIYSWPGMKETSTGLALIGRTNSMQVWAQVFQSDVARINPGQRAIIRAESKGFKSEITGHVKAIIGNVSERDIFASNSNNDVNARVVLVKIQIDPIYQAVVNRLSGMNVVVKFVP